MHRSVVSVSSNIAEGSSRSSHTDLARFVEIAYGSLLESISELEIAKRQEFLNEEMLEAAYKKAEDIAKMLSSLHRARITITSVSLVCDGEIVAVAQEERLTWNKRDGSFPSHAIACRLFLVGPPGTVYLLKTFMGLIQ